MTKIEQQFPTFCTKSYISLFIILNCIFFNMYLPNQLNWVSKIKQFHIINVKHLPLTYKPPDSTSNDLWTISPMVYQNTGSYMYEWMITNPLLKIDPLRGYKIYFSVPMILEYDPHN